MCKPYSDDLRERAVAAMAGGRSCREVGRGFWGRAEHCGELVPTVSANEQLLSQTDGRKPALAAG
jgi:hypothetical protein